MIKEICIALFPKVNQIKGALYRKSIEQFIEIKAVYTKSTTKIIIFWVFYFLILSS